MTDLYADMFTFIQQELHFRKKKVLVTVRHVDSYTERRILVS